MPEEPQTQPENELQNGPPGRGRATMRAPAVNSWWQIATAGAMAIILGLGTLEAVPLLAHPLALLILGISIAAALAPLVERLQVRMPRTVAVIVVYLGIIVAFGLIGLITVPPLISQAQKTSKVVSDMTPRVSAALASYGLGNASLANTLAPQLGQFSSTIVSLPLMLFSAFFELSLAFVMSIYWLIVALPLRDYVLSILPPNAQERTRYLFRTMGEAMGGYFRATAINGLVIGSLTFLGLFIIGADFPLVLGLLAGIFEFIPIVGPIISGAVVFFVTLIQSPTIALIAIVYMFLLQELEAQLLVPYIMRSQTEISPLLVLLALFAGDVIGGLLGALIAIPIVSAIQVLVVKLLIPRLRARLGTDKLNLKTD